MTYRQESRAFDSPSLYLISVQGRIGAEACASLNNLSVANRDLSGQPVTILSGQLPDQAALIGVLNTLYERGYVVLTVNRISAA